jgi:heme ABC exporter ATP-binding subunit CcmA
MPSRNPHPLLDARDIARRFGARWVLRGASIAVAPGEVVGLLGANGSGKSTLLRVLATLLRPNAGTATIAGYDILRDPDSVRRNIGFLAHTPGLYDDLTARENLAFAAVMLGARDADIDAALDRVSLAHFADERVRGFSAGMQRRLAIARLALTDPRLLLLDEPYSNLDTAGTELMNSLITATVEAGGAALIVLHELAPGSGVIDRLATVRDGRITGGLSMAIAEPQLVLAAAAS